MKWLLWREYRLNRLVLIAGSVLLAAPYVIALIVLLRIAWLEAPRPLRAERAADIITGAAIYSIALSQLTLALLGGTAIAGERADRSAEFLAYLPLSRERRLASKLSLSLAATLIIWGISLFVISSLFSIIPKHVSPDFRDIRDFMPNILGYAAVTGLAFFCVAWFISSIQSSPTFAVAGGLVTPLVIIMSLVMGVEAAAWLDVSTPSEEYVGITYAIICAVVALVCFSIGVCYYLRRVEP